MATRAEAVDRSDSGYDKNSPAGRESRRCERRTTADGLQEIDSAASKIEVQGPRLPEAVLKDVRAVMRSGTSRVAQAVWDSAINTD